MRYCGEADVDGSCIVVWHATPPHLVKVKINFDEARSGFISTPRCDQ